MVVRVLDGAPESILQVLERAVAEPNAFSSTFESIDIGEWAAINVHIPGEIKSAITPPFMEAFLELQRQINQLAALAKTGSPNIGGLTEAEREELQVNVLVTGGSSDYSAKLVEPLRALLKQMIGKMTGKQAVIVILGVAALGTAAYSFSAYLEATKAVKLEELKSKDHIAALQSLQFASEENNKTVRRIAEVLEKQGEIGKRAIEAMNSVNDALLKAAAQTPKSVINNVEVTRQEAELLRAPTRRKAEPAVATKLVQVVDINTSDPLELLIILVDAETKQQYRIKFKDNLFADQDRRKLFKSLEDRQPIWAELAMKEIEGEVRSVELLRATDAPETSGQK